MRSLRQSVETKRYKSNPKWFDKKLKIINQKYRLHCKLRAASNNSNLKIEYLNKCKEVEKAVCHSIFSFEEKLIEK